MTTTHSHECRQCLQEFDCTGTDTPNGCIDFDGVCTDCARQVTEMTYTAYSVQAGNDPLTVHRTGCAHTRRPEARTYWERVGEYRSVADAVAALLDDEMIEMGFGLESVRVFPCCKTEAKS
jgi:hypothetical protein